MLYKISHTELDRLLRCERESTVIKTLSALGMLPDRVSQNRAEKIVGGRVRLRNFVSDGRIKPLPNGRGKTSTVTYDYAQLLELKNSEKITIYKSA